ncbi:MAG TPA: flavodoxin-dependent (E)-4-hydroxy-3-methylbut-2-enyl-diphosphate synthase [Thermoanaerobaculia bacterium]|nr:flavodoxin-dependent (E)-4-hydroxy-3-methylbut-2-enyl-diphosphate synthase [Thermoanaerobaculia bacterium]
MRLGSVFIGGGAPITVQSMTKTETADVEATLWQIRDMIMAGCEIVRVTANTIEAADVFDRLVAGSSVPVIADVHFDYRCAIRVMEKGVTGLRLNPGNIGARWKVEEVTRMAGDRGIPIRIGVNAGSLEKDLLKKYGEPTPEAMVESAFRHLEILESLGFFETKVSLKASNVPMMVDAYRLFSKQSDYPLHLGVTEAGSQFTGSVKSAMGIGILLSEGIGDTIRVSLATDPVEEVRVGREILKGLHLRDDGVNVIACPTCGRLEVDMLPMVERVEKHLAGVKLPLQVAIMGCSVNGPGEAREADIGFAAGKDMGMIYKNGEPYRRIGGPNMLDEFIAEIDLLVEERTKSAGETRPAD